MQIPLLVVNHLKPKYLNKQLWVLVDEWVGFTQANYCMIGVWITESVIS